jgi:hypothetical protein
LYALRRHQQLRAVQTYLDRSQAARADCWFITMRNNEQGNVIEVTADLTF